MDCRQPSQRAFLRALKLHSSFCGGIDLEGASLRLLGLGLIVKTISFVEQQRNFVIGESCARIAELYHLKRSGRWTRPGDAARSDTGSLPAERAWDECPAGVADGRDLAVMPEWAGAATGIMKEGRNSTDRRDCTLRVKGIGAILALGLAARLLVLWFVFRHFTAQWFFHRGIEMGLLAESLVEGKGLSSPFVGSTGPTAFFAPGYPLLISAIFTLFGSYTTASAIVIMALHVTLNLVTILLIMHLALRLGNSRTAILGGVFWAVSLPLIWMPTIFWETSFSCCIMVASLAFAFRLQRSPRNLEFLLAGACIAIAGLINPAMLPMLVTMLLCVAFQCRKACPYGLLFAMVTLGVLFSPWPLRNARVFHTFIPLRSEMGFEMWMGNHAQSTGHLDESLFPTFNPAELREYIRLGEVGYVAEKSAEARHYISSHPMRFLSLTLRRVVRFWAGSGTMDGSPIFILHACITTFFGFVGLGLVARRQRAIACLSVLPLLLFPLPYYVAHAEFRFRLIVDPLLTVFAAYAVSASRDWEKKV
jgi:hypothetical protein